MREFKPSATNAINAEMNRMRNAGIRVYNLGSGDPIIPNHPAVLKAAEEEIRQRVSPYAPVGGLTELRKATAHWMNRRCQTQYESDHAIVTCGGKFAIYDALQVLLEPGDEVLFASPYWVSYPDIVRLTGGVPKPIRVHQEEHWKLTPQELKRHLTKKSAVFLFNNGCNPTGALYSRKEIEALLHVAAEANLSVISDEVYSELVYDGAHYVSCASFPFILPRLIVIQSCSKNFAMAGWRVGFAFATPDLIKNMIAVQSQTTTGTSRVSQKAALGVLQHADEAALSVRKAMDKRRLLFFRTYNRLFHASEAPVASTLYFFGKTKKSCEEILEKAHVALVPGIAFGVEGYARFAFSESEEEIVEGLEALHKFI